MKYRILGWSLFVVASPTMVLGQRMPRGSFLREPARTTLELLRQFDTDAEVRNRYISIFGRSREEARAILSRLRPKELLETHTYPIAFYSGTGKWTYRDKSLQKGTQVFVTPDGKPFIKEECGNPLVLALPYPRVKAASSRPPIPLPLSLETPPIEVVVVPPGVSVGDFDTLLQPEGPFGQPLTTTPSSELAEGVPPPDVSVFSPESSPGVLAQPGTLVSAENPFWLVLLLPLLLLGGVGGGGGGGPPPPPGPLIPETSSWILMAGGAIGILVASWTTRRARSA